MLGIVSSQLSEKNEKTLIEKLLLSGFIDYEDYVLAKKITHNGPDESLLFIIYLSLSAKNGHLCVYKSDGWNPSPEELWRGRYDLSEEDLPISYHELEKLINRGASLLSPDLFSDGNELKPLCQKNGCFYLYRFWEGEKRFVDHVERLEGSSPTICIDLEAALNKLKEKPLLPEQKEAVLHALQFPLSIISGGPGTGKTYTAGVFIQLFWELIADEEKKRCRIVLAAPTGKAAANLQGSLNRVLSSLDGFQQVKAETIHSLLQKRKNHLPLQADLILVDESSMIDVGLMAKLFESVKDGARLILLGDSHQLPPVEAGSLFRDLILLKKKKGRPVGELKSCLRTEVPAILELASAVYGGDVDKTMEFIGNEKEGIRYHRIDPALSVQKTQKAMIDHTIKQLPLLKNECLTPELIKKVIYDFCLLTPLRKGPFGVELLNRLIWERLSSTQRKIVPIIITKNDRKKGLFNGDIGVLVTEGTYDERQPGDYAVFPQAEEEGDVRKIPAVLLPLYEFAFCLSVHKSQGSEYRHVSLLLPEGAALFGRELFYTGLTRAKKMVEIWGDEDTMKKMIHKKTTRISGLYIN